jgi:malate synthase
MSNPTVSGVEIRGPLASRYEEILTHDALAFVAGLVRAFGPRIDALLSARRARASAESDPASWDFLPETASVRADEWKVGPIPEPLRDRRVEITGPVDRKMIINALN